MVWRAAAAVAAVAVQHLLAGSGMKWYEGHPPTVLQVLICWLLPVIRQVMASPMHKSPARRRAVATVWKRDRNMS